MASYTTIKKSLCRVCYKGFYACYQANGEARGSDMAAAVAALKDHMAAVHPQTWEMMNRDLQNNIKPFP